VQTSDVKLTLTPMSATTLTMPATPHPGNAIIVGITCISEYGYDADASVAGDCVLASGDVTDNHGNTYPRAVQGEPLKSSRQGARSYIFIAEGIVAPAGDFTITVDPEGANPTQSAAWGAIEVAGLSAPPSRDAWGISMVGGADKTSTTATTDYPTIQANELAVGVLTMRTEDNFMNIQYEMGWTSQHLHDNATEANANPPGHSMVTSVLTSVGVQSHTWTHDNPTRSVAGVIATFKGASQN
jgi:hypothetical protein